MISLYDLMKDRWTRASGIAIGDAPTPEVSLDMSVSIEPRAISSVSSVTVALARRDLCHEE